MKLQHRIPDEALSPNMTGKLAPGYEREVLLHTQRREQAYHDAQKREAAAQRRAVKADRLVAEARTRQAKNRAARIARDAWGIVEARRGELLALERVMSEAPASAAHRGPSSYRVVPIRDGGGF